MLERIDIVKKKLNNMTKRDELTSEEVLSVSEELDLLILEYYKHQEDTMSEV